MQWTISIDPSEVGGNALLYSDQQKYSSASQKGMSHEWEQCTKWFDTYTLRDISVSRRPVGSLSPALFIWSYNLKMPCIE